jgi:hypothetical protein
MIELGWVTHRHECAFVEFIGYHFDRSLNCERNGNASQLSIKSDWECALEYRGGHFASTMNHARGIHSIHCQ